MSILTEPITAVKCRDIISRCSIYGGGYPEDRVERLLNSDIDVLYDRTQLLSALTPNGMEGDIIVGRSNLTDHGILRIKIYRKRWSGSRQNVNQIDFKINSDILTQLEKVLLCETIQ